MIKSGDKMVFKGVNRVHFKGVMIKLGQMVLKGVERSQSLGTQ